MKAEKVSWEVMTHGEKKFIIWFGLALALWRIIELSVVQNAFLQFLAVGQVPITHKTLSPHGVFLVLATVFSASLLLIFRTELVRSLRRHGRSESQAKTVEETVVITRSRRAVEAVPAPKLGIKDRKLPLLYVPSIRPFARKAKAVLRKAAAAEYDSLRTIFVFIWKVLVFVAIHVWRFAEPRIRRFDKWLDQELHKNHAAAEIIGVIEECWRSVSRLGRKSEKS